MYIQKITLVKLHFQEGCRLTVSQVCEALEVPPPHVAIHMFRCWHPRQLVDSRLATMLP